MEVAQTTKEIRLIMWLHRIVNDDCEFSGGLLLSIQYKSTAVYPGAAALTVSWNNKFAIEGTAHVTGRATLMLSTKYNYCYL